MLDDEPQVLALGVNCVRPEATASLIRELRKGSGKPIVVYPNSGEVWDGAAQCWRGSATAAPLAELVREWMAAGASLIGGCCRTTPETIREIREMVLSA